jgi:alkylhydroperoxidase/carboxymuconolactone decarboxylase family protein YurZ
MDINFREITGYISETKLQQLKAAYKRTDLGALGGLPKVVYPPSAPSIDVIATTFYASLLDDPGPQPRDTLTVQGRERCLVALLCARREDIELAIHIYLALMEGIGIREIAHVMLLAGTYTGVDNFNHGLRVEAVTLQALDSMTGDLSLPAVVQALAQTFEPRGTAGILNVRQ